jgi:2-polyprenyl-6-methoxyphenol hydroxylase-like FAD-dependent oxidoreductase
VRGRIQSTCRVNCPLCLVRVSESARVLWTNRREAAYQFRPFFKMQTASFWEPVYDLADHRKWSSGRTVLMGDATHAISPHAGQGASLALQGVINMAKQLRDAAPETAFERFQQARQLRVSRIIADAGKRGEGKQTLPLNATKIRDFILTQFLRFRGNRLFNEAYGHTEKWA